MKLIKLHSKTVSIVYKNSLCSFASFAVFLISIVTVILPIIIVSWLNPYSGVSESRILFEQPEVLFQFRFIFIGTTEDGEMIACSTFPYFNRITSDYQRCQGIKFWKDDFNYDLQMDKANFELKIDTNKEMKMKNFHLVLFFDATLKHKCILKPPAVIFQYLEMPNRVHPAEDIYINSRLELIQNMQFICPFYGRNIKSHFRDEILHTNASRADLFDIEALKKAIKSNLAYFKAEKTEVYFRKNTHNSITLNIALEIVEVPGRYQLNVWERLGQFWLYFASFFIVIFYIANTIKNFLFSRHILRTWEIIPWKKLY